MNSFNKCAYCKKTIIVAKNGKKRTSYGSAWLKYYFDQRKIDIKTYKQLHDLCYRELVAKKNSGLLIDDLTTSNVSQDQNQSSITNMDVNDEVEVIDRNDCNDEKDDDNDQNEDDDEFSDNEDVEETVYNPETTTDPVLLDYAKISNDRCSTLTGITKNQFLQVWSHIKDFEYPCKMSSINGLGFYLTRLRTGLSIQKLAKLIPIASCYQVNFLFIINFL
jgi:hypothetical protein